MSNNIAIVFPHQLFKTSQVFEKVDTFYLVEEFLFFTQYKFHQQKLAFHRASMKAYQDYLSSLAKTVHYIEATQKESDVRILITSLKLEGIQDIHIIDPTDNWLEKRIKSVSSDLAIHWYDNHLFINTKEELSAFFKPSKKKFLPTFKVK